MPAVVLGDVEVADGLREEVESPLMEIGPGDVFLLPAKRFRWWLGNVAQAIVDGALRNLKELGDRGNGPTQLDPTLYGCVWRFPRRVR